MEYVATSLRSSHQVLSLQVPFLIYMPRDPSWISRAAFEGKNQQSPSLASKPELLRIELLLDEYVSKILSFLKLQRCIWKRKLNCRALKLLTLMGITLIRALDCCWTVQLFGREGRWSLPFQCAFWVLLLCFWKCWRPRRSPADIYQWSPGPARSDDLWGHHRTGSYTSYLAPYLFQRSNIQQTTHRSIFDSSSILIEIEHTNPTPKPSETRGTPRTYTRGTAQHCTAHTPAQHTSK